MANNHVNRALRFLTLDCVGMNLASIGCPLLREEWKSACSRLRSLFPLDECESEHLLQFLPLNEITTKALEDWCAFTFDWVNSPYPWWRFYMLRLEKPKRLLSVAGTAVVEAKALKDILTDCEGLMDAVKGIERSLIYVSSDWDEFLLSYYRNEAEPELGWKPDVIMRQTAEMFHFQRVICARCSSLSQADLELLRDLVVRSLPSPFQGGNESVPTLGDLSCPKYRSN